MDLELKIKFYLDVEDKEYLGFKKAASEKLTELCQDIAKVFYFHDIDAEVSIIDILDGNGGGGDETKNRKGFWRILG